jgi:hypothetical protein
MSPALPNVEGIFMRFRGPEALNDKQGNSLLRFLLVEAAQIAVRHDPDWRRRFLHLAVRRERRIAKVAMARKLAVRLYWMWRKGWDYQQVLQFGSHAGQPVKAHGVK